MRILKYVTFCELYSLCALIAARCDSLWPAAARCASPWLVVARRTVISITHLTTFLFFLWHFCIFERTSIYLKNWSKVNIWNDLDIFPVKDANLHIAILCLHRYRGLFCSSESTIIFSDTFLVYCWITHGDIILNRSSNSVFPCLKIFCDSQVFHLVRTSGIWMKLETLRHQAFYSKF